MPISDEIRPGDVVVVPFPYSDRFAEKRRPALVVSNPLLGAEGFVWIVMITSSQRHRSPYDFKISDLVAAGLPAPSIVRATKIACLEPSRIERRAGRVTDSESRQVCLAVQDFIGFGPT